MAAGHCDKIVSIKEFIEEKIIKNAQQILKTGGYNGNEFNTTSLK